MAERQKTDRTKAWFDWLDQLQGALAEARITAPAFALAIIITRMINAQAGECWPGAGYLAGRLGVSERTITTLIVQLETAGLLLVARPGANRPNRYRLPPPPALDRKPASDPTPERIGSELPTQPDWIGSQLPRGSEAGFCVDRKPASAEPLKEPSKEPGETIVSLSGEVLSAFEQFWTDYPKKRAKGAAERAFNRVLAEGAATAAEVLAGVEVYARWAEGRIAADGSDRFIPNPSTWLAEGGWSDRPLPDDRHGRPRSSAEVAGDARRANLARAFDASIVRDPQRRGGMLGAVMESRSGRGLKGRGGMFGASVAAFAREPDDGDAS